jgi:hypothetical protein
MSANRDRLVDAGAQALVDDRYPRYPEAVPPSSFHRNIAAVVVDAVEPLIRADERARLLDHLDIRREALADLRAQVEALITPQGVGSWNSALEAVLALLDGDGS